MQRAAHTPDAKAGIAISLDYRNLPTENWGGKIFDPFLGSGSSRLAAYSLDVDFYGCELDTRYYEMQQERFERECLNIISLNGRKVKQPTLFDI